MTDRIKGLVVSLDRDYRDDDVESIVNAILMVKGVAAVKKSVSTPDDWMNRTRISGELFKKVYKALHEEAQDDRKG